MLNLDQLRIFQAVAQSLSFTRAAGMVNLTQPGISKHVKQMEEHFGVPLFDRLGKRVAITPAGEILLQATQEIMALVETAEQRIQDLKGLRGGRLRIGSSFPVGVYMLPRVLAEFRHKFPAVEVALEISVSHSIQGKVLANEVDLGLVSHDPHDSRLQSHAFMSDELVAIFPIHHPWRGKHRIAPQDLAGETFIVAARGAGTRTVVEERLKAQGIVLENVLDFGNLEGVKHAVEAGLGVSIQARNVVRRETADGILQSLPLAGMEAKVDYLYIRLKNKHLSNAARAFLEVLSGSAARS